MKNCFAYTRVSTLKQEDGVSLEAQRDAIFAYAERNEITVTKWLEEKETAAKKGRPLFNKMISELKRRKADGLVIHKIDRSARNFTDWAKIGELADAGFKIHFVTESLDFESRGGRLVADVQAVVAADYIRNLREECIKGMNGRLKQGLYPWAAPLGYLDNGGGKPKTPDPIRAPLIKELYELYATGNYSFRSIVPEAERIGLRNHRENLLSKKAIENILRNPFYTGIIDVRSTSKVFQGVHQPIVSPKLFQKVADVRAGRTLKKSNKHNCRFRGLFRCGHCKGAMTPEIQRQKVYYRCHKPDCETKTVSGDLIEEKIQSLLKRYRLTEENVASLRTELSAYIREQGENETSVRAPLELAKLKDRLSRLTDKLIDDLIDEHVYSEKKSQILLEQKRWEEMASRTDDQQVRLQRLHKFLEQAKSLYSS
ncbi:MAG: recombinase family protein [Parasphingorhabdus sp.]